MRLMLLKSLWLILLLMAGGCMSPIHSEEKEPGGEDVVIDHDENSLPGNAVSFSMDAEQFTNLVNWLGHENTLTIEKPVHVEQGGATLDAKAGTRFSYSMGEESGVFTFERPFPTVKAGFAKLIGGVALHDITIHADGSGIAATGLGRYRFRWLDEESDAGSAVAADPMPEVWCYSQPGCPPCVRARLELAAAKDLKFRVVWKDEAAPDWLQSRPAFWWHISKEQPSQADVNNTRQMTGWNGLKDFVDRWKHSRAPKKYQRTPSVARPDQDLTRNTRPREGAETH